MCGIAGIVSHRHPERADRQALERMVAALDHRGPDERGFDVRPGVALGMARLAIIDLADGQQPIFNESGDVHVVFNGEIYNHRSLRRTLEGLGHSFRTSSDTECIVHAYEEWGLRCVDHLRGMYAFALWDGRENRLVLARDRMGEKPLYYTVHDGALIFASELKALWAGGIQRPALDLAALDEYLTFGFITAPRTIYQGVHKLPAGHWLVLPADGTPRIHRYWEPRGESIGIRTLDEAVEHLDALLQEVVREQMIADVPLGAFLSGGIDSSLIVAAMTQASTLPVKTFCVGFDEPGMDERAPARWVAESLGTEHRDWLLEPDLAELLPRLVAQFDEPYSDKSMVPTYHVAKMAREHVTVALSGDGGDEAFAGYNRYRRALFPTRRSGARGLADGVLQRLGPAFGTRSRLPRHLPVRHLSTEHRLLGDRTRFSRKLKHTLYSDELWREVQGGDRYAEAIEAAQLMDEGPVERLQRLDQATYLPGDILAKVDRMTMMSSLESRAPLLDPRIVSFGLSLPEHLKLSASQGKTVLRALLAKRFPAAIADRPKQGFSAPVARWLQGPLRSLSQDVLGGSAMAGTGWFDRDALAEMSRDGHGRYTAGQAWTVFCLGLWLRNEESRP